MIACISSISWNTLCLHRSSEDAADNRKINLRYLKLLLVFLNVFYDRSEAFFELLCGYKVVEEVLGCVKLFLISLATLGKQVCCDDSRYLPSD